MFTSHEEIGEPLIKHLESVILSVTLETMK